MKKPKVKTVKVLDFNECTAFIEKKYKIDIRDYARSWQVYPEWCKRKGEKVDCDSQEQYARFNADIAAGLFQDRPYQDWWHWLIEVAEIHRGGTVELHPEMADGAEPWQKEILDLFLKEFGTGPYLTDW